MKHLNIAKILLIIVLAFIIAIPVMAITKIQATADSTSSVITNYDGDYYFFVVEESETPLASMPIVAHPTNVGFIIGMTSMSILILAYVVYCLSLSHNATVIAAKLPVYLRGDVKNTNAFLHPVKSYQYIKDAEYSVAQKYVYYN